jgi:PIF1-like helicase
MNLDVEIYKQNPLKSSRLYQEISITPTNWNQLNCTPALFLPIIVPNHTISFRFPRRDDVNHANIIRLHRLNTKEQIFTSTDGGALCGTTAGDKMLDNLLPPKSLTLRIGAQVMLIRNISENLVNGTIGKVIDFMDSKTFKINQTSLDTDMVAEEQKKTDNEFTNLFPVVDFVDMNGICRLLVTPETWSIEDVNGMTLINRTQARSFQIHKYFLFTLH